MKSKILIAVVVLLLICVGVMGVLLYKTNNDKKELAINEEVLNSKIVELEESETKLKEKMGIISNTINGSSSATDSTNSTFTDEEIEEAIQEYMTLMGILEGSPEAMLVKMGLIEQNKYTEAGEDNFIKTDVKYEKFETKMFEYITEEFYAQDSALNSKFKDVDGYLAFKNIGATGIGYTVKEITLKGDYSDSSYIAKVENEFGEEEDVEFHIADSNGKCVISYCD